MTTETLPTATAPADTNPEPKLIWFRRRWPFAAIWAVTLLLYFTRDYIIGFFGVVAIIAIIASGPVERFWFFAKKGQMSNKERALYCALLTLAYGSGIYRSLPAGLTAAPQKQQDFAGACADNLLKNEDVNDEDTNRALSQFGLGVRTKINLAGIKYAFLGKQGNISICRYTVPVTIVWKGFDPFEGLMSYQSSFVLNSASEWEVVESTLEKGWGEIISASTVNRQRSSGSTPPAKIETVLSPNTQLPDPADRQLNTCKSFTGQFAQQIVKHFADEKIRLVGDSVNIDVEFSPEKFTASVVQVSKFAMRCNYEAQGYLLRSGGTTRLPGTISFDADLTQGTNGQYTSSEFDISGAAKRFVSNALAHSTTTSGEAKPPASAEPAVKPVSQPTAVQGNSKPANEPVPPVAIEQAKSPIGQLSQSKHPLTMNSGDVYTFDNIVRINTPLANVTVLRQSPNSAAPSIVAEMKINCEKKTVSDYTYVGSNTTVGDKEKHVFVKTGSTEGMLTYGPRYRVMEKALELGCPILFLAEAKKNLDPDVLSFEDQKKDYEAEQKAYELRKEEDEYRRITANQSSQKASAVEPLVSLEKQLSDLAQSPAVEECAGEEPSHEKDARRVDWMNGVLKSKNLKPGSVGFTNLKAIKHIETKSWLLDAIETWDKDPKNSKFTRLHRAEALLDRANGLDSAGWPRRGLCISTFIFSDNRVYTAIDSKDVGHTRWFPAPVRR